MTGLSDAPMTVIVIVNYNTSNQVIECLKSLDNERLLKTVVVDNASPSDSPDDILINFPEIELIKLPENVGFGEGCNVGYRWAITNIMPEFIMFLNPDTVIESGLINTMESRLVEKNIGAVTPLITLMDDESVLWYGGGEVSWFKGSANVPGCGLSSSANLALLERDVTFATGCAVMVRSEVLVLLGGFDPRYFMYEEDVELSLSISSHGYSIRYVPSAVVRHVGQGSQGDDQRKFWMYEAKNPRLAFFVYYTSRNRIYTVLKHANLFQKLLFVVGFSGWILRRGTPWLLQKRYDAFNSLFRGMRDALKNSANLIK